MARPPCCRRVHGKPVASVFKPAGVPARDLDEVVMTLDEFEAIRLSDVEGMYQEEAASRMKVSRSTFGRILEAARGKTAEALIHGKALKIDGGPVQVPRQRKFRCSACACEWEVAAGTGRPSNCPRCRGNEIRRI